MLLCVIIFSLCNLPTLSQKLDISRAGIDLYVSGFETQAQTLAQIFAESKKD